jgi:hypothetical protein
MLVQDMMTGALHEVPDTYGYGEDPYGYGEAPEDFAEGELVYDGLGNPVGFLPAIAAALPGIAKALPGISNIASRVLPRPIASIASRFLPGLVRRPGVPTPARTILPPVRPGMFPAVSAMQTAAAAMPLPRPYMPHRMPPGWARTPVAGARRMYMRCAMWPGPPGLSPTGGVVPLLPPPAAAAPRRIIRRRVVRRRR